VLLTRQRVANFEMPGSGTMGSGWFYRSGSVMSFRAYDYWCGCGQKLEDGPCGGGSVNAVCDKCRVNYGCLPGYFPH